MDDDASGLDTKIKNLDRRRFLRTTVGAGVASAGGVLSADRAIAEGGEVVWTFEARDEIGSPTVVDGTVFVGSRDNNVYALDASSGDQKWAFETGGWAWSAPMVVDGIVFVGSGDNNVYALDASSGDQKWAFETGESIYSSPTVVDGTVFVGSGDNNVYALDASSGNQQWVFETGSEVDSSPTVIDGTVFVGSGDNNVYALDASSGDQKWAFETGESVYTSPTVADGTVFVGSADWNVYALDAATGEQQWALETSPFQGESSADLSPTVADGTVFVGGWELKPGDDVPSGSVYALDASTGEEVWVKTTAGLMFSPVVVDGIIFSGSFDFSTGSGNLYALDAGVDNSSRGSRVKMGTLNHHDGLIVWDVSIEITALTTPVAPENPLTVTTLVSNTGSRRRTETITVELATDGQTQSDSVQVDIDTEQATTETLELGEAPQEPGKYSVRVSGSVDKATDSLRVLEPASFAVESVEIDSSIIAGESATVRTTITNTGEVEATQTVEVAIGDDITTSADITLAGGGSTTASLTLEEITADPGDYPLTVETNSDSLNETVQVLAAASITVEVTELDSSVIAGDDLTVTVSFTNTGGVQATRTAEIALGDFTTKSVEVTLEPDETATRTVTLATPAETTGPYPVTVTSGDDMATQAVTIEDPSEGSDNSSSEGFVGRETVLAAGGGGLGTGTLLGAYALLRRRRQDSISQSSLETDEDRSVADTDENDEDTLNSEAREDAPTRAGSDESALEAEISTLEALTKQSSDGNFLTYRGYHSDAETPVFVHTLSSDADNQIRQPFSRAVDGWYNGHSHPNVVTIHDRGTEPRPWVATHRFEAPTLAEAAEFEPGEVVTVIADAAEALRNLALYNVSHGNLAPEHIWVEETDEGMRGVVDDWGLRRAVAEADGETHLTPYTAPEQLARKSSTDSNAIDVYGLGAVTYKALTGQPATQATRVTIQAGEITPPSEVANLQNTLDKPVLRALRTDPANRFNSAYDFVRALEGALD
jgi:outer membrane protein assembly factor BamB